LHEEDVGWGWAKTNELFFIYPGQKRMSEYIATKQNKGIDYFL